METINTVQVPTLTPRSRILVALDFAIELLHKRQLVQNVITLLKHKEREIGEVVSAHDEHLYAPSLGAGSDISAVVTLTTNHKYSIFQIKVSLTPTYIGTRCENGA